MKTKTKRNKIIHEERVLTRLKGSLGLTNLSHSKSESPDFILHGFSGNIGVEITELLESDTKEHSSIKSNLTDRVIDLLDEKLSFPFILDILFEAGAKSRKVNSQRVIELYNIFKGIGEDLENHQRIEFFKFDSPISDFPENIQDMIFQKGYKNLPEGVSRVSITREDFLSHSYNSQREGGLVPSLTIEKIQETIDKKIGNLPSINRCMNSGWFWRRAMELPVVMPVYLSMEYLKAFLIASLSSELSMTR